MVLLCAASASLGTRSASLRYSSWSRAGLQYCDDRTARQIVPVEKAAEFSAVGRGGVSHGETPYKPVSAVEHVFAAEKRRLHLVIRTIGQARATAKITLANLAYNFTRLAWLTRQAAAA